MLSISSTGQGVCVERDFYRIAKAMAFIDANTEAQPSLDDVAKHLHLSPHHFHRLFVSYCGVTPKQFLQILTVSKAKHLLKLHKSNLEVALGTGLSGGNRLHDHFISIEAVTPGEYKNGGEALDFFWGNGHSPFGTATVVWTDRGVHRLAFNTQYEHETVAKELRDDWPNAKFNRNNAQAQKKISEIFRSQKREKSLKLWVTGTNFQVSVWRALLRIDQGALVSYGTLAQAIGKPKASRAVGSAVGKNPIAYLIPCHRVIQNSGVLGGYRWEPERKKIMLSCELGATQVFDQA